MDFFLRHYNRPGSVPGLQGIELPPSTESGVRLRVTNFSEAHCDQKLDADDNAVRPPSPGQKLWIDVAGELDTELLARLGERFGLHTLALEDVAHQGQRPKVEEFSDHLFLVLNMPFWDERWLAIGQVSLFLGKDFVISLHSGHEDVFEPVRRRLESSPGGRMCRSGVDYLFYALIDLVVDHSFPVLDNYGEELQEIETSLIEDIKMDLRERIHETRRELVFLKRSLWSQRDALVSLVRDDTGLLHKDTRLFLRDCQDHAAHVLDLVENYREVGAALIDIQLANINQSTQDSLRTLTVIATIFIPLSFIVGVYGMNFDTSSPWNMPELNWRYGYLFVWGVMVAVVTGMLVYFRRKGLW